MRGYVPEESISESTSGAFPALLGGGFELLLMGVALVAIAGLVWLVRRSFSPVNSPAPLREPSIQDLIDGNDYAEAAQRRMREGDFEKALALFQNCGNRQKAAECCLELKQPQRAADLYRQDGRVAEAAHYYQQAGAWTEAAECHELLGHEREAAELLERAGDLGRAALMLRGLGDAENAARLFERAGLPAEAASALLQAFGSEPAILRRAAELFHAGDKPHRAAECLAAAGDWARAGEFFEDAQAITLAAQAYEHASAWDRAAALYEQAEAFPEARANYERAGDLLRSANIALRMGWVLDAGRGYYKLGSYERAIETLQSIAPRSPEARDAALLLSRIFIEKGLHDRAREKLEAIAAPDADAKDHLTTLSLLAEAYERAGDVPQALKVLEEVVQVDENFEDACARLERLQDQALADTCPPTATYDSRYELLKEIGRGGMGVVYTAQDRELGRVVAVKFLPSELGMNDAALRMFRQEARSAAAMNHPNIVLIYDVGILGGRNCILMEYVPGQTVRELMRVGSGKKKRKRALPPRKVAEIAHETCAALAYAHTLRIIHRDVKPANIIISENGRVKLTDFGISKMLEGAGNDETQAKGTPQYMAPEQILGRPLDGRADLYALGISMFEMTTGRRPFVGEDVVDKQLHQELPDPASLNPDTPEKLAEIILRACAKQANARYANAEAMQEALAGFLQEFGTE